MEVIKPVTTTRGTAGLWEGKMPDLPPKPTLGHGASGSMWEGDPLRQLCMGAPVMELPPVPVSICSHLLLCAEGTPPREVPSLGEPPLPPLDFLSLARVRLWPA